MNYKDIERNFLLGGEVRYHEDLYVVIAVNDLLQTFTLERLNDQKIVPNVRVEDLS